MDIKGQRDKFCRKCQAIDFRRLFFSAIRPGDNERSDDGYEKYEPFSLDDRSLLVLGFPGRISRSARCPLCNFVRKVVSARTKHGPLQLSDKVWKCRFGILDRYSLYDHRPFDEANSTALVAWQWPFSLQARLSERVPVKGSDRGSDSNWITTLVGSLSPESSDLGFEAYLTGGELPVKHYATGRIRPLHFDTRLIRSWLQMCEESHLSCRWLGSDSIRGLKLLDVHNLKIVSVEAAALPRYIALSYVWGGPQKVRLQQENRHRLHDIGLENDEELHPAIQDAIRVIREIGENYLWVDVLCITQDLYEEVQQQIPQMGNIFQAAVLTIIAAPDKDTIRGLPGMVGNPARSPQSVLRLDDMALVSPIAEEAGPTIDETDNSVWITRAWTIQESLLSRRRLIFTSEQVSFSCQACDWCEDMHLESTVYKRGREYALPHQNKMSLTPVSLLSESLHVLRVNLQELVMKYSTCHLTHEEDRLAALTGVLSTIEERSKAQHRFFWGLWAAEFEVNLCWEAQPYKYPMVNLPHPDVSGLFPSFSWLGWCGPAEYHNHRGIKLPYGNDVEPTIQCYRVLPHELQGMVEGADEDINLPALNLERISPPLDTNVSWTQGSTEVLESDLDILHHVPTRQIEQLCFFWSSTIPVTRDHLQVAIDSDTSFPFEPAGLDGDIEMRNLDPGCGADESGEYELAAVGWKLDSIGEREKRGQYFLVLRREPGDPVSRRVGLGTVRSTDTSRPEYSWLMAEPKWKLIVLG